MARRPVRRIDLTAVPGFRADGPPPAARDPLRAALASAAAFAALIVLAAVLS